MFKKILLSFLILIGSQGVGTFIWMYFKGLIGNGFSVEFNEAFMFRMMLMFAIGIMFVIWTMFIFKEQQETLPNSKLKTEETKLKVGDFIEVKHYVDDMTEKEKDKFWYTKMGIVVCYTPGFNDAPFDDYVFYFIATGRVASAKSLEDLEKKLGIPKTIKFILNSNK